MKSDEFDNQPLMFAIAESEVQRFREVETENTLLKVQIEGLKKENEQLKAKLRTIKTCHFNGCIGCTHKSCDLLLLELL